MSLGGGRGDLSYNDTWVFSEEPMGVRLKNRLEMGCDLRCDLGKYSSF